MEKPHLYFPHGIPTKSIPVDTNTLIELLESYIAKFSYNGEPPDLDMNKFTIDEESLTTAEKLKLIRMSSKMATLFKIDDSLVSLTLFLEGDERFLSEIQLTQETVRLIIEHTSNTLLGSYDRYKNYPAQHPLCVTSPGNISRAISEVFDVSMKGGYHGISISSLFQLTLREYVRSLGNYEFMSILKSIAIYLNKHKEQSSPYQCIQLAFVNEFYVRPEVKPMVDGITLIVVNACFNDAPDDEKSVHLDYLRFNFRSLYDLALDNIPEIRRLHKLKVVQGVM